MSNSLWGDPQDFYASTNTTDNIFNIMEQQCQELESITKGSVSAIFGELKTESVIKKPLAAIAESLKMINASPIVKETVDGVSTESLVDASHLFYEIRYAFELYTETYRFRLFQIKIPPSYPVIISIDEGIRNDIRLQLSRFKNVEKSEYIVNDEAEFCYILELILQNRKVKYIVKELMIRKENEDNVETKADKRKVVICEGKTDEIILQAIAKKLNRSITTITANGRNNIISYLEKIKSKNEESDVLVVVDSDGNAPAVYSFFKENTKEDNYTLIVIDNSIEDWLSFQKDNFSKLDILKNVDKIIEQIDFEKMRTEHNSFNQVIDFICKES